MPNELEPVPTYNLPEDPAEHTKNVLREYGLGYQNFPELLDVFILKDTYGKASMKLLGETATYIHLMVPSPTIDAAVSHLYYGICARNTIICKYSHEPVSMDANGLHIEESYDATDPTVINPQWNIHGKMREQLQTEVIFTPLFLHDAITDPLRPYLEIIQLGSYIQDLHHERLVFDQTLEYITYRAEALQATFLHWYAGKFPDHEFSRAQEILMVDYPDGYMSLPFAAFYTPGRIPPANQN